MDGRVLFIIAVYLPQQNCKFTFPEHTELVLETAEPYKTEGEE